MIYSPRAQPELNKSHISGIWTLSKNTDSFTTTSFFHTVLQGWQKRVTLRKNFSSDKEV